MSKLDEIPFLEPSSVEQLPAQVQNDSSSMVEWATLPVPAESESKEGLDVKTLLHSLRRHWILGAVLGLFLGATITVLCIFFLPKSYTASAMIKVDMHPDDAIVGRKQRYDLRTEYEIFKRTQALSVRSDFVLRKALRDKDIHRLSIYQREEKDPIKWLQEELVVSYPQDAELMVVSLTDDDKREVTEVVNAIVAAYMDEVVERAKMSKRTELASLETLYAEKKDDSRGKRDKLKRMADKLKTTDVQTVSIQQRAAMEEYRELRRAKATITTEFRKVETELAAAKAALSRLQDKGVSKMDLLTAVGRDMQCGEFQRRMAQLKAIVDEEATYAKTTANVANLTGDYARHYESAERSFESRKAEIESQLLESQEAEISGEIADLELQRDMIKTEKDSVEKQFKTSESEIEKLGRSSVDLELMKSDVKNLDAILSELNVQLEQKRFELRDQSRISIRQPAQQPESYDSPKIRLTLAIIAGIFGGALPLFALVLIDVQKKLVNGPDDVETQIGLPIMGSIPVIPGRALKHLGASSGTGYHWNMRLAESIDSISARLLRSALIAEERVVLITSAVSGEGKTTLAIQLAMSLARAGKRTVLVDFDLRRPAIDKAFQLPLDPGISEALCGESDISELGQSVGVDNLDVITAGRCDRHVLQSLANGEDDRVLARLKGEYDFVIVDGSPILPVADSRYVAQHVDSVVMSVFRDLSRTPKVLSAYNILKSFGIENIEAVIASPCDAGYGVVHVSTTPRSDMA
ncbi:MAG: AAA family ATPase [Planctomycetia bacterium]|jgi:capsular exopolysaccharide synthesis family protein